MEAPPVIDPLRRRPAWWLTMGLPVAAMAAVALVLFLFNPSQYGFYPRCILYRMTGVYCPGCGALRASHQLIHGHFLTALRDNALLVLSVPYLAFFAVRYARCWLADAPLPRFTISLAWMKILTVVVILFTILRNIPWAPFTWLAPV